MAKLIPAVLAVSVAVACGGVQAQTGAGASYVTDGRSGEVRNAFAECWRSMGGTPALEACEPRPVAAAPAPVREPEPVAQPAPVPVPVPRPVIAKVSLQSEVLFEFNKATLREEGKRRLDELAAEVKGASVEEVLAVGHADRVASEQYNQELSERRAGAVRDYLVGHGFEQKLVRAEGRGESEPVTGGQCARLKNAKLLSCLQPDRRVEIEVFGTREVVSQQ